ncbi:MAG: hypothetical protein IPL00_16130 [Gammaproteobacteria bacterium]|nr:hypothetical protein [Gammaproteobacteria bacterium]
MTVSGSTWIAIMGLTERGFTGHQHVDRLDLIHMNGRTYDPKLGRFMQADIVVQSPFDTQSYNRYSYLMNNPLNGTDPSGYFSVKEYTGVIVAAVLTWVAPQGAGFWYSTFVGAASGAAGAAANGGSILQGAAIGAFSGAVLSGINGPDSSLAWGASGDIGQHALNIAANGVAGGAISVVQGGKFGHGFASAGFSSAAGGSLRSANIGNSGVRVIAASIVGGTASVISGGKFANGAITAAFQAAASEIGSGGDKGEYSEGDGLTYHDSDINDPAGYFDSEGNPLLADLWQPPQGLVDGVTGFGDGVYSGITFGFGDLRAIRGAMNIDGGINYNTGAYNAAYAGGAVVGASASGGALWTRLYGATSLSGRLIGHRQFTLSRQNGIWNSGKFRFGWSGKNGSNQYDLMFRYKNSHSIPITRVTGG